jgi:hypothetical protein
MKTALFIAVIVLMVASILLGINRVGADADHRTPEPPPVESALIPPLVLEQTTTTTTAPPPTSAPTTPVPSKRPLSSTPGTVTSIVSTAYCETGRMANGEIAHDGAVSSHVLPRGSSWRVLDGPYSGRVLTVEDTGPLATFDIAMPGRCDDAIAYGRRVIEIEAA